MDISESIKNRLKEIDKGVMSLLEDQLMSLTEKNKLMKPLVDEKKVLENTQKELEIIKNKDYSGTCSIK